MLLLFLRIWNIKMEKDWLGLDLLLNCVKLKIQILHVVQFSCRAAIGGRLNNILDARVTR